MLELDRVERPSNLGERAQAEKIELGDPDAVEVVLVKLENGAAHRGGLDRQIVAEQRGGEHEATRMRGAEPRKILKGCDGSEERAPLRCRHVQPVGRRESVTEV